MGTRGGPKAAGAFLEKHAEQWTRAWRGVARSKPPQSVRLEGCPSTVRSRQRACPMKDMRNVLCLLADETICLCIFILDWTEYAGIPWNIIGFWRGNSFFLKLKHFLQGSKAHIRKGEMRCRDGLGLLLLYGKVCLVRKAAILNFFLCSVSLHWISWIHTVCQATYHSRGRLWNRFACVIVRQKK